MLGVKLHPLNVGVLRAMIKEAVQQAVHTKGNTKIIMPSVQM
jgi:hypothetical protein